MPRSERQLLRRNCFLALGFYLGSWLLGTILTLRFLPPSVIAQVDIHPTQQNAWFYISHNLQLELLFLAGALTMGAAPVLLLVWNGCLDGILATAVALHYGLPMVLASLLPHGIPEALAWVLIGTCSLLLGRRLRKIFFPGKQQAQEPDPEPDATTLPRWRAAWARLPWPISNIYGFLIIASMLLIILAGILEASVSPWLMHALG
jgi:uncharacterized membrane protein SpoIIM required for sporulation